MQPALPEVTALYDCRGGRTANAVGAGEFWYDPGIWTVPGLSPAARVLYAGLCSFVGHKEINRKDLRNVLKGSTDEEINAAFEELARNGLVEPASGGFEVYAVGEYGSSGGSEAP